LELFSTSFRIYSGALASLFCFSLASIALLRKENNKTNRLFVLSNVSLGLWNISDLLINALPERYILTADRLSYIFALFVVPSFFLLLIDVSAGEDRDSRLPKILSIAIFFFVGIAFTPLLIKAVTRTPEFEETPGPLYPLFIVYFISWLLYGLVVMYKAYQKSEGFKKNQLKYFFLALVIAFAASINYFICMFSGSFPPFYYLIEAAYAVVVAYAVVRYKLMDFDLLIRWGVVLVVIVSAGALFFSTLIFLTVMISKRYHAVPGLSTLIGVVLLAACYEPLRKRTISYIDHFIYQSPDFRSILEGITDALQNSSDIPQFSQKISEKLQKIWKVEHAGILVWSPKRSQFDAYPAKEFESEIIASIGIPITLSDFLVRTLESERRLFNYGVVVSDEVDVFGLRAFPGERITFQKIRRTMRWLGATVCVPVIANGQLIAFLVLGNKRSGKSFNREDKKILSHVGEMISNETMNRISSIA
jgi:hypothetical protein